MTYLCSIFFIFVVSFDPLSKNKSIIIIKKCLNFCKQLTLPGRTVQQLPFFKTIRLYTVLPVCEDSGTLFVCVYTYLGHSSTTFPNTKFVSMKGNFVTNGSFCTVRLINHPWDRIKCLASCFIRIFFFYVFYSRVGEIFVFTVTIP